MSLTIELYDTEIEHQYIKEFPITTEKISISNQDLIAAEMNIVLDNVDATVFSDLETSGLFYGTDWYNQSATIYDSDQNIYIWDGRIKNIQEDWNNRTITVKTTNYIRDIADMTCVYSSSDDTTPAEHIYNILTDSSLLAIPDASIDYDGFQNAINIQDAGSAYVNMTFTKEKGKKCLGVIQELCRMCQMHIYMVNGIIKLYQWEEWAGQLGFRITNQHLHAAKYKHWYDTKTIYNDYKIVYVNGAGILYSTDSDSTSIATYGTRSFLIPPDEVDSTASADYNIIFRNALGAGWAGDLAISRFQDMVKYYEIEVSEGLNFLNLGEQTDLHFDPFIREPSSITKIDKDPNKKFCRIQGAFLNTPHSYYARDTEAPVSPELIDVIPDNASVFIKWTKTAETDHLGYYIYLTTSLGEWYSEHCNLGQSPLERKTVSETRDGYCYQWLYKLNNGTEYSFKVSDFDTSYNESAHSNILSCRPQAHSVLENMYMCQGHPYTGLTLDIENTEAGTVPTEYTTYDDFDTPEFDSVITAIYESDRLYNADGWTSISWFGWCFTNYIKFSYRTYDGAAYSSWSSEVDARGAGTQSLSSATYFQYRLIFYSVDWNSGDEIIITDIS